MPHGPPDADAQFLLLAAARPAAPRGRRSRSLVARLSCLVLLLGCAASLQADEAPEPVGPVLPPPCTVLADKRLEEPLRTIVREYCRRSGSEIKLYFEAADGVNGLVKERPIRDCDVVVCMVAAGDHEAPVSLLPGATKVAWKHPTGEPVWAAVVWKRRDAAALVRFLGGPTGHWLWAKSRAGFRVASGKTSAEAYNWVVEHRTKHTYPMTAMRMLAEIGGIRDGICIDVGCGSGLLDVELAKRSNFKIIGLDIDANVKPLFEANVRKAGLQDRISFVLGDAQKMPFPDDTADVIVSRGTLTFIPDKKKCLREAHRVLKPTGVAFLGGRYVFTPRMYMTSTEALERLVAETGIPGATVIESRGQWVKIVGPEAPDAARTFQGSPEFLANRFIADYAMAEGKCLLICDSDGGHQQALQRGFVRMPRMDITALYASEKALAGARERIRKANLAGRITCTVGTIAALPFGEGSFDVVAGVGPVLIWQKDKVTAMREVHRVLREGGAALLGGRYLHMPAARKVASETLRKRAADTCISSIRVYDDMGQWVEIRRGIKDRGFRD